jgi:hypothetical protein
MLFKRRLYLFYKLESLRNMSMQGPPIQALACSMYKQIVFTYFNNFLSMFIE